MRRLIFPALLTAIVTLVLGCKGEGLIYSVVPHIEFVSLTPKSVIRNNDPVFINLTYTDGDGDLGDSLAASPNFYIEDIQPLLIQGSLPDSIYRDSIQFHNGIFPNLVNNTDQKSISGTLEYGGGSLPNTSGSGSFSRADNALRVVHPVLKIWLFDRAGHKSNIVTITSLTITN